MENKKFITNCGIIPRDYQNSISVIYNDGTSERLFEYFPDEMVYSAFDFIGLTRDEAIKFILDKQTEYLRKDI